MCSYVNNSLDHTFFDSFSTKQLKAALWLPIGNLVDKTTMAHDKNASPQFIGALTELVWEQIKDVAVDTEAFARYTLLAADLSPLILTKVEDTRDARISRSRTSCYWRGEMKLWQIYSKRMLRRQKELRPRSLDR